MPSYKLTQCLAALGLVFLSAYSFAQSPAGDAPEAVQPPNDAKPNDAKPDTKEPKVQTQERIEVQGKRDEVSERRNSTAAKIIISRQDIEQYGDTNLGDVLRRLPGVTQGGRPGRGDAPRMRGMGGGYTQILIDGERAPPGFSIESISPEQVERIEILRAPTAETGARAIAGTINIILREPLRLLSNEVKVGVQAERGKYSPNLSYSRNDKFSDTGTYNFTLSANRSDQLTDTQTDTTYNNLATGLPTLQQQGFSSSHTVRDSVFVSSRFQWQLGQGENFTLQPFLVHNELHTQTQGTLSQSLGATPAPYASSFADSQSNYDVMRLNAQLVKRLDPQTRAELRGNIGQFKLSGDGSQNQFDANNALTLSQQTTSNISDQSWSLNGKVTRNFESGHTGVVGAELERVNRTETNTTLLNGVTQLADFGADLNVSSNRRALYVQDEWDPAPNWSANLGLRWEAIETRSDNAQGNVRNESRVLSPIGHLVWRFDAPHKDQIRLSLTQSYKPPTTQQLVSRPSLNTLFPVPGANTATSADRAGNGLLKPELAQGIDLAYERYLNAGGIISVNLFRRNITDLIRNVTALENVSWANSPRWVTRPQNIGDAITQGIEFDAKFRLQEIMTDAPAVNLRLNASFYDSKVSGVKGPYNRIDQQPRASGNFGADYKLPSTQWTIGGNLTLTPPYTTQTDNTQSQLTNIKRVIDVYAQWAITPTAKLRFGLANVAALDSITVNNALNGNQLETVTSTGRTDIVPSLRLEMRL